ncbi:MAG: MotA/TolQ/ExbB proton channel family protein [Candidatus Binatia bacterium]
MFELFLILYKGGPVMVPLLSCSILAVAVTIERLIFWRRVYRHDMSDQVLLLVQQGDLDRALAMARAADHPVTRVLQAGLEHKNPSPTRAMEAAAQAELPRLKRYLPILDTVITLALLLGLLGTVTGMIRAFGIVSEAGLGQPHAITGGIAEALIATATGLFIAVITLVPYNYFRAKVEKTTELMEERGTRLELLLQGREA